MPLSPTATARPVSASNAMDMRCHRKSDATSIHVAPRSSEVSTVPKSPTAMARPVVTSNATELRCASDPDARSIHVAPRSSEVRTVPSSPTATKALPSGNAATALRDGIPDTGPSAEAGSRHLISSAKGPQVAPAFVLTSTAPWLPTATIVPSSPTTARPFKRAVVTIRRKNAFFSMGVTHHRRPSTCSRRPGRGAPIQLRRPTPCSGSATNTPTPDAISPVATNAEAMLERTERFSDTSFMGGCPGESEAWCHNEAISTNSPQPFGQCWRRGTERSPRGRGAVRKAPAMVSERCIARPVCRRHPHPCGLPCLAVIVASVNRNRRFSRHRLKPFPSTSNTRKNIHHCRLESTKEGRSWFGSGDVVVAAAGHCQASGFPENTAVAPVVAPSVSTSAVAGVLFGTSSTPAGALSSVTAMAGFVATAHRLPPSHASAEARPSTRSPSDDELRELPLQASRAGLGRQRHQNGGPCVWPSRRSAGRCASSWASAQRHLIDEHGA